MLCDAFVCGLLTLKRRFDARAERPFFPGEGEIWKCFWKVLIVGIFGFLREQIRVMEGLRRARCCESIMA